MITVMDKQKLRQFTYYQIHYVPDIRTGDVVTLGAILWETDIEGTTENRNLCRFLISLVPDRVKALLAIDPNVDIELLEALLAHIDQRITGSRKEATRVAQLQLLHELRSYSNSLMLSEPKALLAIDAAEALHQVQDSIQRESKGPAEP